MAKASFPSDTITFKASTGGNSAGNGGDGYNEGNIISMPSIHFNPTNKAEGADVHVKNGDDVSQKAYWDAGGRVRRRRSIPRQRAARPIRMATKGSESGHNKSDVDANTKAVQENWLAVEQGQTVDGRRRRRRRRRQPQAEGGEYLLRGQHQIREPDDVLNDSKYFHIDDFLS
jgi:hypothetical protein